MDLGPWLLAAASWVRGRLGPTQPTEGRQSTHDLEIWGWGCFGFLQLLDTCLKGQKFFKKHIPWWMVLQMEPISLRRKPKEEWRAIQKADLTLSPKGTRHTGLLCCLPTSKVFASLRSLTGSHPLCGPSPPNHVHKAAPPHHSGLGSNMAFPRSPSGTPYIRSPLQ